MDVTALSKIENGRRGIKVEELQSIAQAIGMDAGDLLGDGDPSTTDSVSDPSRGPQRGRSARDRLAWLSKLNDQLRDAGIRAGSRPGGAGRADSHPAGVETLAGWSRARVDAATVPVVDFETLINAIEAELIVDVLVDPEPGPSQGGALVGPDFAAIYVNSSAPTDGSLYALAHELGHVLIGSAIPLSDDADFGNSSPKERAANAFAGSFLMPAAAVAPILEEHGPSPAALAVMMLRFGVAWNVLLSRLHRLGYLEPADQSWLEKLDQRVVAENVREPRLRAALLSRSAAPCGLHHAPRWITTRAWIGARRGAIPMESYAALTGEHLSAVGLPRQTIANGEIQSRLRTKHSSA